MGQAESSNYTSTVIGSYASVLQYTSSTAMMNSYNEAKIAISGGTGDVNISKINVKQLVENDLKASFEQTNDSSILQSVSQEIQQQANSLVSGLNFGNYSESNNSLESAITASMDVSQTISTSCVSTAVNSFELSVKERTGDIKIEEVNVEQDIQNGMECAAKSLNQSSAVQDIKNKVEQTATAKTEGLSIDFASIIIAVVVVIGLGAATAIHSIKNIILMVFPIVLVLIIEYFIYTMGLKIVNAKVDEIKKVIEQNKKIKKLPKPQEQLKTFNYTCGLNGIGNYTGCLLNKTSTQTTSTPIQNVSGCKFTKTSVDAIFSSPDDAYNYWMNNDKLKAIDIIAKQDGTYEYHFYSEVSKECITLMESVANDPNRTYIPQLVCKMYNPIDFSNADSQIDPALIPEYSFVFNLFGILFYSKNKQWVQVNKTGVFDFNWEKNVSAKNVKISITPIKESPPIYAKEGAVGNFYFVDMSKARRQASAPAESEYKYIIYKYKYELTDKRDPTVALSASDFSEHAEIDVTDLVLKEKIGPFMANPNATNQRNCTVIWDTDIDPDQVDKENNALLAKFEKEQKIYQGVMGTVAAIGFIGFFAAMISAATGSKTTKVQVANKK